MWTILQYDFISGLYFCCLEANLKSSKQALGFNLSFTRTASTTSSEKSKERLEMASWRRRTRRRQIRSTRSGRVSLYSCRGFHWERGGDVWIDWWVKKNEKGFVELIVVDFLMD